MLGQQANSIPSGANYDATWLLAHRLCWPGTLGHLPFSPTQAQGNATLPRQAPLDPSPQDTMEDGQCGH